MSNESASICFTLIHEEKEIPIETNLYEFENLMELIQNRIFTDEFGECLGMGRCCTCLVEVSSIRDFPDKERNETSTLLKNGIDNPVMRLSCQIEIGVHLTNSVITIAKQM
jgi:2Fe-2S ferredoxin